MKEISVKTKFEKNKICWPLEDHHNLISGPLDLGSKIKDFGPTGYEIVDLDVVTYAAIYLV